MRSGHFAEGRSYQYRGFPAVAVYVVRILSVSDGGEFLQVEWMDSSNGEFICTETLNVPTALTRRWDNFLE